ncbi:MAG TPA: AAA family ATPase [Thermoanaerobaculia bacterium]|jgi:hypothetical protein|nr:AAA family ATPase [Thermoanaerobaculia bacterium]
MPLSEREGHRAQTPKRVLVVGDWLVDDHWVVAEARSPTASRIGKTLFRSLQGTLGSATSLCGAGRTASILVGAVWTNPDQPADKADQDVKPFEVAGIGTWHRSDTDYMHTLLEAYRVENWEFTSVHQRSAHTNLGPDDLRLLNLAELLKKSEQPSLVGTTSIVRVYQRGERGTHLRERIDFELRAPGRQASWLPEIIGESTKKELGEFCRGPFDAVVVKDLGKGTVSPALIQELANSAPNADWFVSSKTWSPKWLRNVPEGRLRLLMIPEMAILNAVRQGKVLAWTTPWGSLTRDALSRLDLMLSTGTETVLSSSDTQDEESSDTRWSGRLWAQSAAIMVSFDDLRVHLLARGTESQMADTDSDLFSAHFDESARRDLTIGLPFSSVLLPAVVATLLHSCTEEPDWQAVLEKSLRFTSLWRRTEAARIHNPADWDSREHRYPVLGDEGAVEGIRIDPPLTRKKELGRWNDALSGTGVLTIEHSDGPEPELQLWRATSDLEHYVCCSDRKRAVIRRMLRGIREFMSSGGRFHQGCVLIAPPGSGKSFLIKCLARRAGIRMLEPFNMTQISSHAEIYGHIFDKVHEEQQREPDAQLLVFVDEINADHGKQPAYDAFLEPLQDGTYVSNGRRLNLAPCYWIFVSTKVPQGEEARKWDDFKSRLQHGVHFLVSDVAQHVEAKASTPPEARELENELAALKLENVYLGIRAIKNSNPWVTHVTRGALNALQRLRVVTTGSAAESRPAIDNRTLIAHLRGIPVSGVVLRRDHLIEEWLVNWSDHGSAQDNEEQVRIRSVPGQVP